MKIDARKSLVLLLSAAVVLGSCSSETENKKTEKVNPISVTVGSVGKNESNSIQSSGKIGAVQTAVISTRIMGFITGIKVKPGDKVQKGQLLATISNSDIMAKRGQAQAMVAEAEAALIDAKKDHERYAELYRQQSASAKEFENITLHYNSVKAKTEAAHQMQKEAEAMLAYTNLVAPFSGVVTQKNANEGSMANPGMPILVLEHAGAFQVDTFVSERDITNIKTGADAEIVIKSTGKTINGTVSEVSPSSQMSGGQYLVKVLIDDKDTKDLYAGMYAHVSIASSATRKNDNQPLLIPTQALIQRDQLNGLYTISGGNTALLRWVTIGKTYGDQVEILSGLSSDEQFILSAEGKLYNGVPVSIKKTGLSDNR